MTVVQQRQSTLPKQDNCACAQSVYLVKRMKGPPYYHTIPTYLHNLYSWYSVWKVHHAITQYHRTSTVCILVQRLKDSPTQDYRTCIVSVLCTASKRSTILQHNTTVLAQSAFLVQHSVWNAPNTTTQYHRTCTVCIPGAASERSTGTRLPYLHSLCSWYSA